MPLSTRRLAAAAGTFTAAAISAAVLLTSSHNHAGLRHPNTLPPCTPGYTLTPSQVAGTGSPHPGSGLNTTLQSAPAGTVVCLTGDIRTALSNANIWLTSMAHSPNVVIRPAPGATVETGCWTMQGVQGVTVEGFTGPSETGGAAISSNGTLSVKNVLFSHNVIGWCPSNVVTKIANSNIVFSYDTFDDYSSNGINTATTFVPDVQVTQASSTAPVCPQGVILTHNTVLGYAPRDANGPNGTIGNPDGFDLSAADCGVQFTYNYIQNLTQGQQTGANHSDSMQDLGGGGPNNLIKGNLETGVADCFLAADNDTGLTYTDNVCSLSGALYYAQCLGCVNDHFDHNTMITAANAGNGSTTNPQFGPSHPSDGSLLDSNLYWTNNLQVSSTGTPGAQMTANPAGSTCSPLSCTFDYNVESPGVGSHDVTSGAVTFAGGATPTTFQGFALASGSAGIGAASDGKNMGVTDFSVTPGSGIPGP